MFFFKKKHPEIKVVQIFKGDQTIWNEDTVLFYLHEGKELLQYKYGKTKNGELKAFLLLDEIPLIKWHSDEYNCPTCEKLLAAGYGRNKVPDSIIESIKNAGNNTGISLVDNLDIVKPLLYLMETGLYAFSYINLNPTDGDKRFFWDIDIAPRCFSGSCNIYHNFSFGQGRPAYILPTQPAASYNFERVQYYRNIIKSGKSVGGIAYYLDGYLCALLDGHHRATACFLEEVPFRCLTLMRVGAWGYEVDRKKGFVNIGGQQFDISNLEKNVRSKLESDKQRALSSLNYLDKEKVEYYLSLTNIEWNKKDWSREITEKAQSYPSCYDLLAIEHAGDLSDERLNKLFAESVEGNETEYDLVLRALIALRDQRAVDMALRVAKSTALVSLWEYAFIFLSRIKSQRAESFFMDFLVYDDNCRPKLTKIACEYFSKSDGEKHE